MMTTKAGFLVCSFCLLFEATMPFVATAQELGPRDKTVEGQFEITLKTPEPSQKLRESELIRDRESKPFRSI